MNKSFDVPSPVSARGATLAPRDVSAALIDYGAILVTLWRRKALIALGGLIAAAVTMVVLLRMESVYVAHTEVLLDTRERQVINIQNVVDDAQYSDSGILSEIAIIRSTPIRREVARRLNLPQYAEFNPPPEPESILERIIGIIRGLIAPAGESEGGGEAGPPPSPVNIAGDILQDKVTVSQLGLSYILRIEIVASSPRLAADIANAFADVYLDSQVEAKLAASQSATEWLALRANELRVRVEALERDLERGRVALIRDGHLSIETLQSQLGGLSNLLIQTRSAHVQARERANRFEKLIAEGDIEAATRIASSDTLAQLVLRRDNLREQRLALSRAAGDANPGESSVAAALATVNARMLEEARSVLSGLRTEEAVLDEQVKALQTGLGDLELGLVDQSEEMVDLRALEREVAAQRNIYQTFLTRLTEARERGDLQEPDARIVSLAEPPGGASGPKRKLLTLVAFAFGAGACAALVLFREARRDVFRTASEAEKVTGFPVLATLARNDTDRHGMPRAPSPSTWREFRRLALMLGPRAHGGGKAVLATSVLPVEGAPAVAQLFAEACATHGWRVMMIDLEHPAGNALEGHGDVIEGTPAHEKRCESAISILPDPSGLSESDLAARVAEFRRTHDVVVVHAPAVLAAVDSLALANVVDHVLLAFRWERTPRGAIAEASEELARLHAPMCGLVMTGVDVRTAAKYEYAGASYVRRVCSRRHA